MTHTQMVPTMFVRLLKLDDAVRRGATTCRRCAASCTPPRPCPVEVKRRMIEWLGPIVNEYYASTEANGGTMIDSAQWLAHPGSVGVPLIGTPHICGEDGAELPTGEIGTLYFEREEFEGALVRVPQRPREDRLHPAPRRTRTGPPSATSATSTPTASST